MKKIALTNAASLAKTASNPRGPQSAATAALNIVHRRPVAGSPSAEALAAGLGATPAHNLRFRGGRTIQDLTYVNLYVGGQPAWSASDIQNIDRALAGAMTDSRLDTVINQYFNGAAVSTTAAASEILPGPKPKTVSRATIDTMVQKFIVSAGRLNKVDPATTVFNFLLPRGVLLTTDGGAQASSAEGSKDSPVSVDTVTTIKSGGVTTTVTISTTTGEPGKASGGDDDDDGDRHGPLGGDPDDAASSLQGLGGYHGSVHIAGTVVYFAVGVFSESLPGGKENGIVAFNEPWKNVVGTFYHELQEARTDPDVEDAIRTQNLNFIGWNSDQGEEIGDFPVFEADPLQEVFREVPLLAGGKAPIQLMYSNRVNGPEDPTA